MAKLTLTFKGRLLAVYRLEQPSSIIGRDPTCPIFIDSLAIAPRHAELGQTEDGLILTALDDEHPVFRNGQRIKYSPLVDGDVILIGKHTLTVSLADEDAPLLTLPTRPTPPPDEPADAPDPVPAYLQIQSGPDIGQVINVTRAVTRLQRIGGDEVIISRRGGRYLLTRIGEANRVDVGRQSVQGDTEVELTNGVEIEVDGTRCQFFCADECPEEGADSPPV